MPRQPARWENLKHRTSQPASQRPERDIADTKFLLLPPIGVEKMETHLWKKSASPWTHWHWQCQHSPPWSATTFPRGVNPGPGCSSHSLCRWWSSGRTVAAWLSPALPAQSMPSAHLSRSFAAQTTSWQCTWEQRPCRRSNQQLAQLVLWTQTSHNPPQIPTGIVVRTRLPWFVLWKSFPGEGSLRTTRFLP